MPVTNTGSPTNLPWSQCGHYTSRSDAWWAVDLGATHMVESVKLYNRNDCCPNRLQNVQVYLGSSWESYAGNTLVASDVDVPQHSPLTVPIQQAGRYLWVAKSNKLTICAIEVYGYAHGMFWTCVVCGPARHSAECSSTACFVLLFAFLAGLIARAGGHGIGRLQPQPQPLACASAACACTRVPVWSWSLVRAR